MGLKDEIREAKMVARVLHNAGDGLPKIAAHLNKEFEGHYYVTNEGRMLYRENTFDYAPPVRII